MIVCNCIHVCPVNQSSGQWNNSKQLSLSLNLSLSFSLALYSISHTVYSNGINKAARNAVIRGFIAFLDQCNYSHPLATSHFYLDLRQALQCFGRERADLRSA